MAWSGSGLTIDAKLGDHNVPLKVPDDIYMQGCVKTASKPTTPHRAKNTGSIYLMGTKHRAHE